MAKKTALKVTLYYHIKNGGDGSASVHFYEDAETAQLAADLEMEKYGESLCENTGSVELEFDAKGKLLNPEEIKSVLLKEWKKLKGKDAEERNGDLQEEFARVTQPRYAPEDMTRLHLAGTKLVFTGELSTNRAEAEALARSFGATVSSKVTPLTDFVIVGKNAGSKLDRALSLGVCLISSDQWNRIAFGSGPGRAGPGPAP